MAAAATASTDAKDVKAAGVVMGEREKQWFADMEAGLIDLYKVASSDTDWVSEGADTKTNALQVLSRSWKTDVKEFAPKSPPHFLSVQSKTYKMFKCNAKFAVTPQQMFSVLQDIPKTIDWNPTVTLYKILHQFTPEVELNICTAASAAGGLISARDFINLRTCCAAKTKVAAAPDNSYLIGGTGVVADNWAPAPTPVQSGIVRGWNGLGGYLIEPIKGREQETVCLVHWVINADLKGWLPRSLIDGAMCKAMTDWCNNLRSYLSTKKYPENQKFTIKNGEIVLTPAPAASPAPKK